MSPQGRRRIAALLGLLWAVSLLLPTLRTNGSDWGSGWWLLASGWMGLLVGQLAWLANPLLILAVILLRQPQPVRWLLGGTGLLLLLLALQVALTSSLIDNEGNIPHPIEARYLGYWTWLAAVGLAGIIGLWAAVSPRGLGIPSPDDTEHA